MARAAPANGISRPTRPGVRPAAGDDHAGAQEGRIGLTFPDPSDKDDHNRRSGAGKFFPASVATARWRAGAHRHRPGDGGGASVLFWASQDYPVVARTGTGRCAASATTLATCSPTMTRRTSRRSASTRPLQAGAADRAHPHLHGGGRHGQGAEIARRHGMIVSLGIWISPDLAKKRKGNRAGHQDGAGQPPHHRPGDRGNETQLNGFVSPDPSSTLHPARRQALPAASR